MAMSDKQWTLKEAIEFSGRGLHTGLNVTMKVLPAADNHGIIFKRIDLEGAPEIAALGENVSDTSRGTTIAKGEAQVSTIEHIMSALWTMGVDNALIEIDAPETPIMDGSAKSYAEKIEQVGIVEQNADRQYFRVREKMEFDYPESGSKIVLRPDDCFSVSCHIDFNSPTIGNQYASYACSDDNYTTEIAPCRTFVFLHELEPLLKMNLIKGGDLDNAIVIADGDVSQDRIDHLSAIFNKKDITINNGYVNNLKLRFTNEIARHKLLDLMGDFALLGMRIKGNIMALKSGHKINTETIKAMRKEAKKENQKPRYQYDSDSEPIYDINAIRNILPHRPPFLLVDKIIHIDNDSVAGIKNVTMNEPFFVGHFPEEPVMPGVLIIEAMAQCGGILALHNVDEPEKWSTYFTRIDEVKFSRKVVPGDTLQFELRLTEPIRRGMVIMSAKTFVGGVLATEAHLTALVVKNK